MVRSQKVTIGLISLAVLAAIVGVMIGIPKYNIWQKEQQGRAELAQAEFNRQIAVREAEAQKDAAVALAEAEVARARGVAEANRIIGESLQGNEAYLRYLWVIGLQDSNGEVVYVATEAGMPILEAGRGAPVARPE